MVQRFWVGSQRLGEICCGNYSRAEDGRTVQSNDLDLGWLQTDNGPKIKKTKNPDSSFNDLKSQSIKKNKKSRLIFFKHDFKDRIPMTIKYAHMNYLLLFVSMSYLSNHILCRATEKHMQNRPKKRLFS